MAIIVILAILFSCILLILCLPVSYALTIHIGTPFHIEGQGRWGRKLADASWSYTLGEEPHHELHMCWKRSLAVKESVEPPLPTAEEEEKAWDELEKESQRLTYEDLLRQEGPDAPAQSDAKEAKKKKKEKNKDTGFIIQKLLDKIEWYYNILIKEKYVYISKAIEYAIKKELPNEPKYIIEPLIKKAQKILDSIDNVSEYFTELIKNYSKILDRFEYGIKSQIQKNILQFLIDHD